MAKRKYNFGSKFSWVLEHCDNCGRKNVWCKDVECNMCTHHYVCQLCNKDTDQWHNSWKAYVRYRRKVNLTIFSSWKLVYKTSKRKAYKQ